MVGCRIGTTIEPKAGVRLLSTDFYDRQTATVARDLLGKILRVRESRIWRSGVISETEAYVNNDPANHAFHGLNNRNQSMFKGPGTVYVYTIHGVHCINVVTQKGEAVLIRALLPLKNVRLPTDGPGKMCRALHVTRSQHDGLTFTGSRVQIIDSEIGRYDVSVSRRIGVSKGKQRLLRFLIKEPEA